MQTGTIARLILDKGFGFIKPDEEGQPDLFFHARALTNGDRIEDLQEGQAVEYEEQLDQARGKMQAAKVRLA